MTISFPCEQCGHRFEVDAALAGKKCKCKKCGHVFLIPVPRETSSVAAKAVKTFGEAPSAARPRPVPPPAKKPRPAPADSQPDPYYDDDDPYHFDAPAKPARAAGKPRPDRYGLDDGDPVLPPRSATSVGDAEVGPRPVRVKKKRTRYDGEPWALGLRVASSFFMVVGCCGLALYLLGAAYLAQDLNIKDIQAGKLPIPTTQLMAVGIISIISSVSFLIGALLTSVSFVGTTISFLCGNRRAFGGEGVLLHICWYGSGVVTMIVAGFTALTVYVAVRGPQAFTRDQVAEHRPPAAPFHVPLPQPEAQTQPPPGADFGRRPEVASQPQPQPAPFQPPGPRFGRRIVPGPNAGMPPTRPNIAQGPPPNFGGGRDEPGRPGDEDFVAQVLFDLKSTTPQRRKEALNRLRSAPPDESRRVEVAGSVEPLLRDPESWTRTDAAKALAVWGGKENTKALVGALKDPEFGVVWSVLDALKALKDPAAAEAVAARLTEGRDRGKAVEALKAMGPGDAEAAVVKYLNNSDWVVRCEACKVLQEIGSTDETRFALMDLLRKTNGGGLDGMAAREAMQRLGAPKTAPPRRKSIVPGAGRR